MQGGVTSPTPLAQPSGDRPLLTAAGTSDVPPKGKDGSQMSELFGLRYTKSALLRRVGRLEQVAGVRLVTLGDGQARGVRVLEFRTGTGFAESRVSRLAVSRAAGKPGHIPATRRR